MATPNLTGRRADPLGSLLVFGALLSHAQGRALYVHDANASDTTTFGTFALPAQTKQARIVQRLQGGYFFMCEMVGRPLTWAIYPFAAAIGAAWWDYHAGHHVVAAPLPRPPPARPPARPFTFTFSITQRMRSTSRTSQRRCSSMGLTCT